MVFMSQAAVTNDLRLPGKAGAFLAQMFTSLDLITAEKITVTADSPSTKNRNKFSFNVLVGAIDERLVTSYQKITETHDETTAVEEAKDSPRTSAKTTPAGWLLIVLMVAGMYGALIL
jgi:hypothetical protein